MIILDTHIWIWWVCNDPQLPLAYRQRIQAEESSGLGIAAISLWESAMLIARGRLIIPLSCEEWLNRALSAQGLQVLALTPQIAADAVSLPGAFHRDPADQLIVATARVHACPLVTLDGRIRSYAHVQLAP